MNSNNPNSDPNNKTNPNKRKSRQTSRQQSGNQRQQQSGNPTKRPKLNQQQSGNQQQSDNRQTNQNQQQSGNQNRTVQSVNQIPQTNQTLLNTMDNSIERLSRMQEAVNDSDSSVSSYSGDPFRGDSSGTSGFSIASQHSNQLFSDSSAARSNNSAAGSNNSTDDSTNSTDDSSISIFSNARPNQHSNEASLTSSPSTISGFESEDGAV